MEKTPFWKKTWFLIVAFIIVPPLGIILMWCCKKKWNKIVKTVLSVIFAFWTLIWGIALFAPADKSSVSENESTTVEEPVTEHSSDIADSTLSPEKTTTQATTQGLTEAPKTLEQETTTKPTTTQTPSTTKPTTTKAPTTAKPTTTKAPTTAKPTTTKAPTTAKPTTTKAPTTARPTTTKAPTTADPDSRVTVYRTKTGEKYHYENPCGNGTYIAISLAEAKSLGLGPCEKCVLH